jgi:hypothetical protein
MEAAPQKGAATPQEKSPHRMEAAPQKGAASPTLLGSQGSNHSVLASDEGRKKKKRSLV